MNILHYFNLPFNSFIEKTDLKYRFNFYKFNNIEKFYIDQIIDFSPVAKVDYKMLNLIQDEDAYYNEVFYYYIKLKSVGNLTQILNLLYKLIQKPTIFIVQYEQLYFFSSGNVSYTRKEINFNDTIKTISSSVDTSLLTYKSEKMLKNFNIKNMSNLKTIFDYIFNIYFSISSNQIAYLKLNMVKRLAKYVFIADSEINTILNNCIIKKKIGKSLYFDGEEIFRQILKTKDKTKNFNYNCIEDIKYNISSEKERFASSNIDNEDDEDNLDDYDDTYLNEKDFNDKNEESFNNKINYYIEDEIIYCDFDETNEDNNFDTFENEVDYSKDLNFEDVVLFLEKYGISQDYYKKMVKEEIEKLGEKRCRLIYNNIKDYDFDNDIKDDNDNLDLGFDEDDEGED